MKRKVNEQMSMYELPNVAIRMVQEHPYISEEPILDQMSAMRVIRDELSLMPREVFGVLCLNTANIPISFSIIHMGTLDRSLVHPRDVFQTALLSNAKAIIVVHNHPSGSLQPSDSDLEITDLLIKAGNILNIPLLDHFIVSKNGCYSIVSQRELL